MFCPKFECGKAQRSLKYVMSHFFFPLISQEDKYRGQVGVWPVNPKSYWVTPVCRLSSGFWEWTESKVWGPPFPFKPLKMLPAVAGVQQKALHALCCVLMRVQNQSSLGRAWAEGMRYKAKGLSSLPPVNSCLSEPICQTLLGWYRRWIQVNYHWMAFNSCFLPSFLIQGDRYQSGEAGARRRPWVLCFTCRQSHDWTYWKIRYDAPSEVSIFYLLLCMYF
jgi:hypothetical protein